ncbi:hypothetical protein PHYPSEUDO_004909 [Phytophthora pseudosyringae]|uniref:Uncharacterized protein n=1 Tax=Phytophthora pseudosyringae TaxID=221518 RepID=A0A8T1WGD4_9STRA|nr:hypothetical protein PHYPSEUDO_004909 [Phytophthora pseudosyringae]
MNGRHYEQRLRHAGPRHVGRAALFPAAIGHHRDQKSPSRTENARPPAHDPEYRSSSQNSPSDGGHEFFLDEFNEENALAQPPVSGNFHPVDDDADGNFPTLPSHFEAVSGPTGAEGWTLGDPASGGEEGGSLLWDLPEFLNSSRSASQQGTIELGIQMELGVKFTAVREHSMTRCSEQPETTHEGHGHSSILSASDEGNATYAELANIYLIFNEVHPAVRPLFTVPSRDQTKSTNADLDNKGIKSLLTPPGTTRWSRRLPANL